jgi:hypothetical protein
MNDMVENPVNTHMAVVPGISAIKGAKIVAERAKKLHKPIAVAANSVGNMLQWATYTKLKLEAVPNEAQRTKNGNTQGAEAP